MRGQARRCMGCGVPFCHTGCPLGNLIPDWNDLVHRGRWREAIERLHSTNNFPEFTGRLCPAPCEEACVLTINDDPVTIKEIEWSIVERAWQEGWIGPAARERRERPQRRRGGLRPGRARGGPAAGARRPRASRVYERDDRPGGLLRYGIPDFKLEKHLIDRRVEQLAGRGRRRSAAAWTSTTSAAEELRAAHDALVLATGAQRHRDLPLPGPRAAGRPLRHGLPRAAEPARRGPAASRPSRSLAAGQRVVVLGGGDTGADCLGNALREGAASVTELAHGPTPPRERDPLRTWPEWPFLLRVYPAHKEGGEREWQVVDRRIRGRRPRRAAAGHARRVPRFAERGERRPVPVPAARSPCPPTSCCSRSASPAWRPPAARTPASARS